MPERFTRETDSQENLRGSSLRSLKPPEKGSRKSVMRPVKRFIKEGFRRFGLDIARYTPDPFDRVVSIPYGRRPRGHVLISYRLEPFLLKEGEPIPHSHTNYWESLQIARTFLELGYSVDVIDFRNAAFVPKRRYALFLDVRHNLERIGPLLNEDCIKVFHIDTSQIVFHNWAETIRLLELQKRKGVTLLPRRIEWPNLGIEYADCATLLGNEVTMKTFQYANKPVYPIPISQAVLYDWPEEKDFEACRKNFLWFGSGGLARKGLDLVLEIFAGLPDYRLTVCGPVQRESDFEKLYYKELYETENIRTLGWVDIQSRAFLEATGNSLALIYPSCAEGQCGGVVTCMHRGLIPIVSLESGVDVNEDLGILLKDCSIETIEKAVRMISGLPAEKLRRMARNAWDFARANHTRERSAEIFRKTIEKILATHAKT
jgi:glycosyltransferase involved in cell wall biosynthesis